MVDEPDTLAAANTNSEQDTIRVDVVGKALSLAKVVNVFEAAYPYNLPTSEAIA